MEAVQFDKPIEFDSLFGLSFRVFGRNFGRLMLIAVIFYLPISVLMFYFMRYFYTFLAPQFAFLSPPENYFDLFKITFLWSLGFGLIGSVLAITMYGAMVKTVYVNVTTGEGIGLGEALKAPLSMLLRLLAVGVLSYLMTMAGMMACYIPGIVLSIYLLFSYHAAIIEGEPVGSSIGRSFELVKKNFWPVFLMLLMLYLIVSVAMVIVSVPLIAAVFGKAIGAVNAGADETLIYQKIMDLLASPQMLAMLATVVFVFQSFFQAYFSVLVTLKYMNLRGVREAEEAAAKELPDNNPPTEA